MANDDVIERAEKLLLEPIVNRMAAGERACQLVIDLVVELRASRARVAASERDTKRLDFVLEHYGIEIANNVGWKFPRWLETREDIDAALSAEDGREKGGE